MAEAADRLVELMLQAADVAIDECVSEPSISRNQPASGSHRARLREYCDREPYQEN